MISLLITLLIVCLVAGIVWWALQQIPLPAPVRMIVVVVFALILGSALGGACRCGRAARPHCQRQAGATNLICAELRSEGYGLHRMPAHALDPCRRG